MANLSNKIKVINRILNNIDENSSIVIYGAGEHTNKLLQYTDILNKNIMYIVDKSKYNYKLYGKFVKPIESILTDKPDHIIISSYSYQEEICNFLIDELNYRGKIVKLYDKNDTEPFYINSMNQLDGESNSLERVCHYDELFINHKGDIYPCCNTWSRDEMNIGNIKDHDIFDKIERFYERCYCTNFKLIKGSKQDKIDISLLNIELSLLCQAKCAMCCVNAPEWKDEYNLYDDLTSFINRVNPQNIIVQGGEVLVQKESIEWLKKLKETKPDIKLSIITNGNLPLNMIDTVEELFSSAWISINGFQEETYKRIMKLDFNNMIKFSQKLINNGKVNVTLKYLISPLNIHEVSLFLNWAIKLNPNGICIDDASTNIYINKDTFDKYWNKIIHRTSNEVKKIILNNKEFLINNKKKILFLPEVKRMFNLNIDFINKYELNKIM